MRTPPGVSTADFEKAIKQFEAAVGSQWVFTSDEDVNTYRDAYSPFWGEPSERSRLRRGRAGNGASRFSRSCGSRTSIRSRCTRSRPAATSRMAARRPCYSGSVVLDLKRMNKILEVNEEQAYALVEPGVATSISTATFASAS